MGLVKGQGNNSKKGHNSEKNPFGKIGPNPFDPAIDD